MRNKILRTTIDLLLALALNHQVDPIAEKIDLYIKVKQFTEQKVLTFSLMSITTKETN
jgi:hypothetical protein